jgi:hypothetical protein
LSKKEEQLFFQDCSAVDRATVWLCLCHEAGQIDEAESAPSFFASKNIFYITYL